MLPLMELLGRIPMGVRAPVRLVRDTGRAISLRLAGRSGLTKPPEVLARLLGRELSVS